MAFLLVKEGVSPFEFADGAYHTHQLAKEIAYLLVQQAKNVRRKEEIHLHASGLVDLQLAMGQVETWLATWDKPPEKHPNIVLRGDVDNDLQSYLETSLARLNTEVIQRFIPRTNSYEEAVMAEAKALANGARIYVDIANKPQAKHQRV